jgi:hypothetical protein
MQRIDRKQRMILPVRLEQLGWSKTASARSEVRWWISEPEQMRAVAANLLVFSPHVFMVFSNPAVAAQTHGGQYTNRIRQGR